MEKQNFETEFNSLINLINSNKKYLLSIFISTFFLSYLLIFFFVDKKYEAVSVIIPNNDSQAGLLGSLLSNFKDLPINIGGEASNTEINTYNTIVFSRTLLEKLIINFDLIQDYKIDSLDEEKMEIALLKTQNSIETKITKENAYRISFTHTNPQKAANITNWIVSNLNKTIIDLKLKKARDNKQFLESRYLEVLQRLKNAEDSLQDYQEKTGIIEAKEQIKGTYGAVLAFESSLVSKKMEYNVLETLFGKDSPKLELLKVQLSEMEKQIQKMKYQNDQYGLIGLKKIPSEAKNYFRLYREVQIMNSILEFIIPLYEQAKFEENKNLPILQIVDIAVPPVKRSFPPRILLSILISIFMFLTVLSFIVLKSKMDRGEGKLLGQLKVLIFKW